MSEDQSPEEEALPQDGLPRQSKWRKRMGVAGLASLGGMVAWIFGRRDKSTPDT